MPVYTAEVAPTAVRGRIVALSPFTAAIGQLVPYLCGWTLAAAGGRRPARRPPAVRGPATSPAAFPVWGFGPLVAPTVLSTLGCSGTFLLHAPTNLLCILLALRGVPETRNLNPEAIGQARAARWFGPPHR